MQAVLAALPVALVPALAVASSHLTGSPMPGRNLWDWLSANILGAFPVILAGVSLYYLVRRAFSAFMGFAIFACLVAIFVYAPDLVRGFGERMGALLLR